MGRNRKPNNDSTPAEKAATPDTPETKDNETMTTTNDSTTESNDTVTTPTPLHTFAAAAATLYNAAKDNDTESMATAREALESAYNDIGGGKAKLSAKSIVTNNYNKKFADDPMDTAAMVVVGMVTNLRAEKSKPAKDAGPTFADVAMDRLRLVVSAAYDLSTAIFEALPDVADGAEKDDERLAFEKLHAAIGELSTTDNVPTVDNAFRKAFPDVLAEPKSTTTRNVVTRDLSVIPLGTVFTGSYDGKSVSCTFQNNADGDVVWIVSGKHHDSPSAAAKAVTGSSTNGWKFWKHGDDDLSTFVADRMESANDDDTDTPDDES